MKPRFRQISYSYPFLALLLVFKTLNADDRKYDAFYSELLLNHTVVGRILQDIRVKTKIQCVLRYWFSYRVDGFRSRMVYRAHAYKVWPDNRQV